MEDPARPLVAIGEKKRSEKTACTKESGKKWERRKANATRDERRKVQKRGQGNSQNLLELKDGATSGGKK